MSIIGRWYGCVGGTGLEVKKDDGEWHVVGYIQRLGRKSFDIRVNPYADEGYTIASHGSLEAAKADFLKRMGVTAVEEDVGTERGYA